MDTVLKSLISGTKAFCLIQKQDNEDILALVGEPHQFSQVREIPRRHGDTDNRRCYDSISIVPYCQVKEKGFVAPDNNEKIRTIRVEDYYKLPIENLTRRTPHITPLLKHEIRYDTTEREYANIIQKIIDNEIGNGEGANFVIPRNASGTIQNFSLPLALSIFHSLLRHDYGTYWKFLFYDKTRCFIGSTPERHLLVEGGRVKMNPISGTFRKDPARYRRNELKKDLLAFLNNPKEINELFMVVDEELKMMAKMCTQGGFIVGPLLKEMSRLIHSEYLLSGESDKDIFDLFIDSMFAATVVGSPLENACRIIKKYSTASRRYYGSAMMLIGRDEHGRDFLDSPITIRTAEIATDGTLHLSVGATLVKDSIPEQEVMETKTKAEAVLASILGDESPICEPLLQKIVNDDDIAEVMARRNRDLSKFWFFKQHHSVQKKDETMRITLIDNGDDFIHMLSHIFTTLGLTTTVTSYHKYILGQDHGDITLVGPGPGNPNDTKSRKIRKNLQITEHLLTHNRPSLFICLGHQILCRCLGFKVNRKIAPLQGSQVKIDLFGQEEMVGFYNTFAPLAGSATGRFEISTIPKLQEVVAIRSEHFAGFQFHPESILSANGVHILQDSIDRLLKVRC